MKNRKLIGLYLLLVIVVTVIVTNLVINSRPNSYEKRLNELPVIEESTLESFEKTWSSKDDYQEVQVGVQGQIIYLTLILKPKELSHEEIITQAKTVSDDLLKTLADDFDGYDLQVIVSDKIIGEEDVSTIRENELAYIKEHDVEIVEKVVSYTEEYPTETNISRSQANIDLLEKSYPEEAKSFQERIDKLTPYTTEEEISLEIPTLMVDQTIQGSGLTTFPLWLHLNKETSTLE